MKKTLAMMAALVTGVLSAAGTSPVSVTLEPDTLALKAGETAQVKITIKGTDGYSARNWGLSLIRKDAPKGFFEKLPSIIKYKNSPGYDSAKLMTISYLPLNYTSGTETMKLNTQGFVTGDYAFNISVDFTAPGKKTLSVYKPLYITITEGDSKPVIIEQESTPFFQVCKGKVTEFTVKPGNSYTFFADVQIQPRCTTFFARAYILRKDLPAEFAGTVQKWTKGKTEAEDEFELSSRSFRGVNKGSVFCYVPTGKLPEGTYNVTVQFKGDKSGGSWRKTYTIGLPVKMTVKK